MVAGDGEFLGPEGCLGFVESHGDAGMVIFFGGDDLFAVADRYSGQLGGAGV